MAETFNNQSTQLSTTSETTVYSAPTGSGNVSIILSIMVSNVDGIDGSNVDVRITDASNVLQSRLCKDLFVPAGASVEIIVNKVILLASQKLRATAEFADRLDVTVSALEIT